MTLESARSAAALREVCRCEVQVATTPAELAGFRDDWIMLRERFGVTTPDADFDFFSSIYGVLGQNVKPYVVLLRAANTPCGLLVGRTSNRSIGAGRWKARWPRLRCLEVVYGGIVTDGSATARNAVLDHLRNLLATRAIDLLEVHHLQNTHELAREFASGLGAASGVRSEREGHWLLEMVDRSNGRKLEHNSSKTRSTFRRKDKKLVEAFHGALDVRSFTESSQIDEFIASAASITAQTYQAVIDAGVMDTERWRTIIGSLAARGRLRGYIMTGERKPIAYVAGALFEGHFTLLATSFVPAYRRHSPGLVLLNRVIALLGADGVHTFDFGFGDADYKQLLGSTRQELLLLRIYGKRWRSRAALGAHAALTAGKGLIKRAIGSLGALDTIKRRWRSRLEAQAADHGV